MFKLNRLFRQRFTPLDKALGEPLTVTDLQYSGERVVAVAFKRERVTTLMRWGWKRFNNGEFRWFWPLIPGSLTPPNNWCTYGTNWQAYEIVLPEDVMDIAIRRRWDNPGPYSGKVY